MSETVKIGKRWYWNFIIEV